MPRPEVVCLTTGPFQENCYLVADPERGEAVVVDPGDDPGLVLRRLDTQGWRPEAVWLTHAHLDHVQGVSEIVQRHAVPVYLHPADRPLYDRVAEQAAAFGLPAVTPPPVDRELADGDAVSVGAFQFEVRHVPGHSPGSVAFVGSGIALVGDALFQGSVGRVDLPGGDGPTLLSSIRDRLLVLPDATVVYSGHGPATTIGAERASNPFLTGAYPLA